MQARLQSEVRKHVLCDDNVGVRRLSGLD